MHFPRFAPVFQLSLILVILTAGGYATDTWDATKDFGDFNPNGAWSYGYGTTGTSFTPYSIWDPACVGNAGVGCWHANNVGQEIPLVGFNTTGHYIESTTALIPPDTLFVHPYAGEDTIVSWTAPTSGTYSIAGFFDILDMYPTGIIGLVYENSTQLYSGELLGPPAQFPDKVGGREDFSFPALNLKAGDVISFAVNDDGDYNYDTTGFNATITAVPEPGSLLFLASGLMAASGFGRRRLKK
jgi:hypothetical protein